MEVMAVLLACLMPQFGYWRNATKTDMPALPSLVMNQAHDRCGSISDDFQLGS